MKLISDKTTLVVTGAWNPSILVPPFIAKEVFGKDGADVTVEIDIPNVPGLPWRYHMNGITYVPHRNRLEVSPKGEVSDSSLVVVADFVSKLLELLKHTPTSGMGHNFSYEETSPTPNQLAYFDGVRKLLLEKLTGEVDIGRQESAIQFKQIDHTLNLKLSLDNGKLLVDFNFHYDSDQMKKCMSTLGETLNNNFKRSKDMLKDILSQGVTE
jgi:hypothetical protein